MWCALAVYIGLDLQSGRAGVPIVLLNSVTRGDLSGSLRATLLEAAETDFSEVNCLVEIFTLSTYLRPTFFSFKQCYIKQRYDEKKIPKYEYKSVTESLHFWWSYLHHHHHQSIW